MSESIKHFTVDQLLHLLQDVSKGGLGDFLVNFLEYDTRGNYRVSKVNNIEINAHKKEIILIDKS